LGASIVSPRTHGLRVGRLPITAQPASIVREPLNPFVHGVRDFAVILLDASGQATGWTAGTEGIKGCPANTIIGPFYARGAVTAGQSDKSVAIVAPTAHFARIGQRVRRDGSVYQAEVVIRAMRDSSGKLLGFAKLVCDITGYGEDRLALGTGLNRGRRETAEAGVQARSQFAEEYTRLKRDAGLLCAIEEACGAAIVSCDTEACFTSWNQAAERIFGYPEAQVIGQPLSILAPDHGTNLDPLIERFRRGEPVRDFETVALRRDGTTIEVALTVSPIAQTAGMALVARAITEGRKAQRALEETQRWLRRILGHAPLMITAIDRDGVYTMAEGQALGAMGIDASKALIGRSAFAVLGPDSAGADAARRALAGETTTAIAMVNDHTFEMWKAPMRDAEGLITGAIGVNTDVSGRVAIEQELQVRLRQQEAIVAISAMALGGARFDELAQETAASMRAALGVECAGLLVRSTNGSSFEARAIAAATTIAAAMQGHSFAPDGSLAAYALSTNAPVIAEDLAAESRFAPDALEHRLGFTGAIASAFGPVAQRRGVILAYASEGRKFTRHDANFIQSMANILTSSGENALTRLKLRRSEEYFRGLIENSSDVLSVVDKDGVLRFTGGALKSMFGLEEGQIVGQASIDIVPRNQHPTIRRASRQAFRNAGAVTRVEFRTCRIDGAWLDCEAVMKSAILGGEPFLIISLRDISDRKRHEEELAHARDVALESARLKSSFLANMSHEVRTPINIILGYADLVADYLLEQGDGSQTEFLGAIARAGQRLLRTIGGVIDYSKLGAGSLTAVPAMLELGPLIEGQMELVQELAQEKGLTVAWANEVPGAEVWFDEYCLAQALGHLLENAIKFTQQGGVAVRVYKDGAGALCLDLKDTGIGIDEAFLPRLLEAFSQEDASFTRRFEGSGLGLALAKGYLDCNGAQLTVTSRKGEGSVFTIKFPGQVGRIPHC